MTIESQVKVLESVVSKIDTSIEKLTEVSNSIGKLLAVHDERLNTLSSLHTRTEDDIREIYNRVNALSKDILDKIDNMETVIENKLKESAENSTKQHNEIKNDIESKINVLSARVGVLETWRWLVIGGATVIGYLADKLIKLFS